MAHDDETHVYGPSIAWSLLFLGVIFGVSGLSLWAWARGSLETGGLLFFLTIAAVVACVFVFGVARYYVVSGRGITIRVLGVLVVGRYPWEVLSGTRGTEMKGRGGHPSGATARLARVYTARGRVAFRFNFLTANFGGLHNDIFLHLRALKRAREEEA